MKEGAPLQAATEAPEQAPRPRWTVCAAVIVKDEAERIEEWIVYHHLIGIEHVFVYDNDSSDDLRGVLAPYITRGLVTLLYWPQVRGQVEAYAHACETLSGRADWLCLFDADEFLALQGVDDLHAYLNGLDCDQVLVRWRMFGHSGHRERQPGLTIETYVHSEPQVVHIVKQIVRPDKVRKVTIHYSRTHDKRTCDAEGVPVREGWAVRRRPNRPALELHHYYSRSYDEYLAKMARKNASGGLIKEPESFERWAFPTRNDRLVRYGPAVRAFIAAVRALPKSAMRPGALAGDRAPAASRAFGEWFDRLLGELSRELAADDPEIRTEILMSAEGSALVISDPRPELFARLRARLEEVARTLVEERGVVPLTRFESDAGDKRDKHRIVEDFSDPFLLPGFPLALVLAGVAEDEQTLRLRVVDQHASGRRQHFKIVGVAPRTVQVTARVFGTPSLPTGAEVRWMDTAPKAGALWAQLALIA